MDGKHEHVPELDHAGDREDAPARSRRRPQRAGSPASSLREVQSVGKHAREDRQQRGSARSTRHWSRRGRTASRSGPRTSQPWAVDCIQLPMLPMNAARMNRAIGRRGRAPACAPRSRSAVRAPPGSPVEASAEASEHARVVPRGAIRERGSGGVGGPAACCGCGDLLGVGTVAGRLVGRLGALGRTLRAGVDRLHGAAAGRSRPSSTGPSSRST